MEIQKAVVAAMSCPALESEGLKHAVHVGVMILMHLALLVVVGLMLLAAALTVLGVAGDVRRLTRRNLRKNDDL